ncbi:Sensor histidine kinase TodS [Enhygromyxa salina]|uniref:histidine kinase n=1 Tax=Enhygromyxa salina TaxID=215803 RepID=A0A2S9YKX9_9BACT|nr:ATP-binding protein [Enhygromyxa salina]PRQ05771.1 Sensor histidine kinase TodS [Enhygromyxa salina]
MLAFSGRGRFVKEDIELSSLIAGFAELLHGAVSDSVSVRLALHPDLPEIQGDHGQLRQLIMNLVVNGSEAIGDGPGELTLATGVDDFGPDDLAQLIQRPELGPGRYVWIEVHDTGSGMDQATRERIFEPFFSTKLAGRGLGLAAALGIARGHGGGIMVGSSPGAGARFKVLLPPARSPVDRGRSESWSRTLL